VKQKIVITKHRRWTPVLRELQLVADRCQDQLTVELTDLTRPQRKPFFGDRILLSKLRNDAVALKAALGLADSDLLVLLVDALIYDDEEDDEDLFSLCSEDLGAPGLAMVSLHYLTHDPWSSASRAEQANSIILNLLCAFAENLTAARTHTDTSGCVMDYCYEMDQALLAVRNGFSFCLREQCSQRMHETEEGRAIVALAARLGIEERIDPEELVEIEEGRVVLVKPIWEGRFGSIDEKLCFVLMPIDKGWTEDIWNRVRQIVEKEGLIAWRADDIFSLTDIMDDVWKHLNVARLVIADLTDRNPNVLYELGIAHTIGKDCILLAQKEADLPFDLRSRRVLLYTDTSAGVTKLERDLPRFIRNALSRAAGGRT
jgi:hypothetical protein